MPYREKLAWLSLVAMAIAFGPYFAVVAAGVFPTGAMPDLHQLSLYAAAATVQIVVIGTGYVVLRRRSPEDARSPLDERDREIKYRASRWAYLALLAGMILVGVVMPFSAGGWTIVNAALFMIVVAEVVHYGVVAISYRSQA